MGEGRFPVVGLPAVAKSAFGTPRGRHGVACASDMAAMAELAVGGATAVAAGGVPAATGPLLAGGRRGRRWPFRGRWGGGVLRQGVSPSRHPRHGHAAAAIAAYAAGLATRDGGVAAVVGLTSGTAAAAVADGEPAAADNSTAAGRWRGDGRPGARGGGGGGSAAAVNPLPPAPARTPVPWPSPPTLPPGWLALTARRRQPRWSWPASCWLGRPAARRRRAPRRSAAPALCRWWRAAVAAAWRLRAKPRRWPRLLWRLSRRARW